MNTEHGVSIRQGCRSVFLKRSTYRYEHKPKEDEAIIDALNKLVEKLPAVGFWQSYHRLRLAGYEWNHKRVYRVYTSLGLNIRRRAKKRLPARTKQQLFQPSAPNQVWSLDFMHDSYHPTAVGWGMGEPSECSM
jgi:putative transposase